MFTGLVGRFEMKRMLEYKDGNILSYAEYGDKNGFPILVQHGLIASIDDYESI